MKQIQTTTTVVKNNKFKSRFFQNISKIDKSLARLTKKIREMTQLNKISNVKIEVAMDTTEVQRIIRNCSKEIYTNKMTTWKKWTHYKNDEAF